MGVSASGPVVQNNNNPQRAPLRRPRNQSGDLRRSQSAGMNNAPAAVASGHDDGPKQGTVEEKGPAAEAEARKAAAVKMVKSQLPRSYGPAPPSPAVRQAVWRELRPHTRVEGGQFPISHWEVSVEGLGWSRSEYELMVVKTQQFYLSMDLVIYINPPRLSGQAASEPVKGLLLWFANPQDPDYGNLSQNIHLMQAWETLLMWRAELQEGILDASEGHQSSLKKCTLDEYFKLRHSEEKAKLLGVSEAEVVSLLCDEDAQRRISYTVEMERRVGEQIVGLVDCGALVETVKRLSEWSQGTIWYRG